MGHIDISVRVFTPISNPKLLFNFLIMADFPQDVKWNRDPEHFLQAKIKNQLLLVNAKYILELILYI